MLNMLQNLKRILVPIDFSDVSFEALRYASSIACRIHAEIIVLHVIQNYTQSDRLEITLEEDAGLVDKVRSKLEELFLKDTKIKDNSISLCIAHGKVHEVIQKIAEEKHANLIVMGTWGSVPSITKEFKKYILGTNAFRTVENSLIPVITLRKELPHLEIRSVVLPLDIHDDETTQKIGYASDLAEIFGAEIHLLGVTDDVLLDENTDEKMNLLIENVANDLTTKGFKVEKSRLNSGDIPIDLMAYTERNKADLLVIMTRKAKLMQEFFLTSDERTIITRSKIPVLSIKCKA